MSLSSVEERHVFLLNECIRMNRMDDCHQEAFLDCSTFALLKHAIDITSLEDVEFAFNELKKEMGK